jgi:hypothetical protein
MVGMSSRSSSMFLSADVVQCMIHNTSVDGVAGSTSGAVDQSGARAVA